jgi:hypothetical protein
VHVSIKQGITHQHIFWTRAFIQNVSPTWEGVVHGLELLKKGAIWRIGSGTSVKIFRDNCIPRSDALKTFGRRRNSRCRWVSELIDPITRTWNEGLVRECCLSIDADAILVIKLPPVQCDDLWLGSLKVTD